MNPFLSRIHLELGSHNIVSRFDGLEKLEVSRASILTYAPGLQPKKAIQFALELMHQEVGEEQVQWVRPEEDLFQWEDWLQVKVVESKNCKQTP